MADPYGRRQVGRRMTLDLRPYQIQDVEQLGAAYTEGVRAVCYVSPTGSGKTVVFAHIISRVVRKRRRVGILVHRRELVHQAAAKLSWTGVPHGIIGAGLDRDHDAPTLVMSAATALRRFRPTAGISRRRPPELPVDFDRRPHGSGWSCWRAREPQPSLDGGPLAARARAGGCCCAGRSGLPALRRKAISSAIRGWHAS